MRVKMKKLSVMVLTAMLIVAAMVSVGWAAAHEITGTASTGGKAMESAESEEANIKVSLTAINESEYESGGWTITPSSVENDDATITDTSFTMPNPNAAAVANIIENAATEYTATLITLVNGKEINSGRHKTVKGEAGDTMRASVFVPDGAKVTKWTSDPDGVEFITSSSVDNQVVLFVMPDHDVTIYAHVSGGSSGSSGGSGGCSVGFGLAALVGAALLIMKKR